MSSDIAQALRGVARGRQSFVVLAVPRLAGKSTVLRAILAERPNAAAVMTLAEDGENVDELLKKSAGGYIVIPEITQSAAMPGYIWGAEVRRIFRAAKIGYAVSLRSIGPWEEPTRRVVAALHEIDGVERGRPRARLLYRWDEDRDEFLKAKDGAASGRAGRA